MADISAIKAGISKYAANRASEQYPTNTEAAKFNLQYVVAYALANGPPTLSAFDEDAINNARVKALARMVSVAIDPAFADAHEDYPTRLAVTLGDGRTLEQLWVYASGTRQYPMSPAQIEDKFLDCAAQADIELGAELLHLFILVVEQLEQDFHRKSFQPWPMPGLQDLASPVADATRPGVDQEVQQWR